MSGSSRPGVSRSVLPATRLSAGVNATSWAQDTARATPSDGHTLDPGLASQGHTIGLSTAVALVVGEVVGVGIFLTPAGMAQALGSTLPVLLVWLGMGGVALCGALCYGELAARVPDTGGTYAYLREAYGHGIAFLYGWKCLLVMDPGLTATLGMGLATYLSMFVPGVPLKLLAVITILSAAVINAAGLRLAAGVGRLLTFTKIGLLLLIVTWGFGSGRGDWARLLPQPHDLSLTRLGVPALAGALVAAYFSFGGWWDASKLAGEVRDPQRTLPRALALGVTIVTALYVLTSAVFMYLVPLQQAANGEAFAAQAGAAILGARGAQALALVVIVSVGSSLLAFMTAAPRVYYALALDGLAMGRLGERHASTGAPRRAIAVQAALACVLVALGRFEQVLAYFIFTTIIFLAASVAALFVLRRRGTAPVFRTPLFPLPALVFITLAALVLALLALASPFEAAAGVLVTLLGWPAYALLRARDVTLRGGTFVAPAASSPQEAQP